LEDDILVIATAIGDRADRMHLEGSEASVHLDLACPYSIRVELQKILASLSGLLAICVLAWLTFYVLAQRFPYVMVGSAAVYNAKEFTIEDSRLLDASKQHRIVVFGNSKVLSGFIPDLFDRSVPGCSSYNLGLPATDHFIPELEKLLVRGERPTQVLITIPWADPVVHRNTFFHFPDDDAAILARAFPFRTWVHDSFILLYRSPQFGGVREAYIQAQQSIERMNGDRGYYFIAGESHFPNNELPGDFRLDSDQPQMVGSRKLDTTLASFRRLNELADAYHFEVLVVPTYRRPGELAPAPDLNSSAVAALRPFSRFKVLGPDYYIFGRQYFSDLLHLNPSGARQYTTMLARLVAGELQEH
jgi:hypothetical protein